MASAAEKDVNSVRSFEEAAVVSGITANKRDDNDIGLFSLRSC
jgi:hypothetical protein